ncbi:hypothetical protein FKR81_31025 [Lentzea tibetensis]|uniref:Uncharacterized protein n=1 Tax=Lentzea tibetensis TaxID=2591470 RepID=A0A563EL11_9PSEU|nr:hypothetical protein [Lentzea tibetensis]TWP47774.1 hypothetical protein FKR81_31025 [Lentzea tibetensis]
MEAGRIVIPEHNGRQVAVYQGKLYEVLNSRLGKGLVRLSPGDDHVSPEQLESWYVDRAVFTWRGEPFDAVKIEGGRVTGSHTGLDLSKGKELGLDGDQYSGFGGTFPLDEVDLKVERTDLLARWKEKHAG